MVRRSIRARYVAFSIAVSAVMLPPGRAADVTEIGTAGGTGTNGTAGNPGTSGGPGGNGTNATATASTTDANNSANAHGGPGGNGGTGGDGVPAGSHGGDGGAGGNAGSSTATASTDVASGNGSSSASAVGHTGGFGGAPGSAGTPNSGIGGSGGKGGDANARATAFAPGNASAGAVANGGLGGFSNSGPGPALAGSGGSARGFATASNHSSGPVSVTTRVIGGEGGAAAGAFKLAGAGGSVFTELLEGISTGGGNVTISAEQFGGKGGDGSAGAAGGNGASSMLLDVLHGTTTGKLSLSALAAGGKGGIGGGLGGNSATGLTFSDIQTSWLAVTLNANGGEGGSVSGSASGITGASAITSANLSGPHDVTLTSGAGGGKGGAQTSGGVAGVGGPATLGTNRLTSTGDGRIFMIVNALGGVGGAANGGLTATGGAGATLSVVNAPGADEGIAFGSSVSGPVTVNVTQTGGTGGIAQHGGRGGDSTLANIIDGSTSSTLTLNQTAIGGDGGLGLFGGAPGNANSSLTLTNATASELTVGVNATGGTSGRSDDPNPDITAGTLNGGAATASADITGSITVNVTAKALGGNVGYTTNRRVIGNGGVATLGPVQASSTTNGAVSVTGIAQGGMGGNNFLAGPGGSGASASIIDKVDGFGSGNISLTQTAIGGKAGSIGDSNSPGTAGSASSSLTRSKNAAFLLTKAVATGGAGADQEGNLTNFGLFSSGNGATANATSDTTNSGGTARADAIATGGDGGFGKLSLRTGNGGAATASATAHSLGDAHPAIANGTANGGNGGILGAAIVGSGVGDGANATSTSIAFAAGNSPATATDIAKGGDGGNNLSISLFGKGGNAGSGATANSAVGAALASSTATGGRGSVLGNGSANATANTASGTAQADATLDAASGSASSRGKAGSSWITNLITDSSAPVSSNVSHTQSRAAVSHPVPAASEAAALQSTAYITGLPSTEDQMALLQDNPNVKRDFNISGEGSGPRSDIFGALTLGGGHSPAGPAQTYVESGSMAVDLAGVSSQQHLLLGLLDPMASGGGFDALRFQMMREGISVIDVSFADLASAMAYFDDRTIDLGPVGQDVAGTLDLSWRFDLTAKANDGFLTTFIVGNATSGSAVPEPNALACLILALPLFSRRRRLI